MALIQELSQELIHCEFFVTTSVVPSLVSLFVPPSLSPSIPPPLPHNVSSSSPRLCAEQLDLPLLGAVQDADAGGHVDVLCAV